MATPRQEQDEKHAFPPPEHAVTAYAERAGLGKRDEEPQPPPLLGLPLLDRLRRIDTEERYRADWSRQCEEWTATADSRYRAIVANQPAHTRTPAVRIGVKDTIDVAGFPTGLGLRHHRHYPAISASAVATIERTGDQAAVTSKVVSTELNIGVGSGCINPCFPHIDPAGSSTGAGVAVAANLCDLGVGTDVLGSVRWPAGHCGTVGLRLTHTPAALNGVFPLSPPMDAIGLVTRTAADLSLLWERLGLHRLVANRESGDVAPARHYRVGVVDNVRGDHCDPEVLDTLEAVCGWLADDGHAVDEVRLEQLWRSRGDAWQLCARQAWDGFQHWRQWITVPLLESTSRALETGARVGDQQYARILQELEACRDAAPTMFTRQDVWLLPLDPSPPPETRSHEPAKSTIPAPGEPDYERRVGYTPIASFAGFPAITVPVRSSRVNGAPLSVQIVGPPGGEEQIIDLAHRIQNHADDFEQQPA
ncbi:MULTISPECIES: amidase [unclassified Actinopolyspora]|uniref:amidase family protein n=1 Tax=unclassified Actinopolyspora TaxID=2639451 RepID=UPI0013F5C35D|nr:MULTISPECIES: amidase [unclassified Actinopolyspora]NHD19427.1 amidase [Actinopolyspora sp. BKK2]NHE78500.1 amidase [Actinopolyspora sp. BKK1]